MKIQCACGTKIAFDITPEMATNPVQFICPNCGLDSSAMVNQLIREDLGSSGAIPVGKPPPPSPPAPPPIPIRASRASPLPAPKPAIRLAIHKPSPEPVPGAPDVPLGKEFCLKHPGKEVTHQCLVCGKPMCPSCMTLFGHVCSPLCKNKAEARGMKMPVYALQKSLIEARRGRKIGLVGGGMGGVLALLAGAWFWYAWFGSVPKVAYALTFPERARAGQVRLADPNNLIFLHGGQVGRIDLNRPQPVWSVPLLDKQSFAPQADATIAELKNARARQIDTEGGEAGEFKIPSREELIEDLAESAMAGLGLHLAGQNIWVATGETLTRFDWQTGQATKIIRLEGFAYELRREGNELLARTMGDDSAGEMIQHIDLATGEIRKETSEKPVPPKLVSLLTAAATNQTAQTTAKPGRTQSAAVVAVTAKVLAANAARQPGAALDPQKIAEQAPGLSYAGKLALPVLIANARNQQRLAAELAGNSDAPPPLTELDQALEEWDSTQIISAPNGLVQFSCTLIERRLVAREAMKAPPKKAALEGNISAANSMVVASEMLNEMQRERGSTVTEDLSRYQVTVKRAGSGIPVWSGEVTGPPSFHPLQTVDLLTAGTSVMALDHQNKKLWQAVLNFPVAGGRAEFSAEPEADSQTSGLGPCVERGDTIYVYDQGSLAAFDRATGNSRWRLPSVGISGLWFDDKGMIYLNTTTAGPESIRYSKQVDLSNQTLSQILKVDTKTGKTLWSRAGAKHIGYLWKHYIYTTDGFPGDDPDGDGLGIQTGLDRGAFLRIRRIDAGSGRILWEHVQKRCPLDLHFHANTIQLLFGKEVQHLKFLAL